MLEWLIRHKNHLHLFNWKLDFFFIFKAVIYVYWSVTTTWSHVYEFLILVSVLQGGWNTALQTFKWNNLNYCLIYYVSWCLKLLSWHSNNTCTLISKPNLSYILQVLHVTKDTCRNQGFHVAQLSLCSEWVKHIFYTENVCRVLELEIVYFCSRFLFIWNGVAVRTLDAFHFEISWVG